MTANEKDNAPVPVNDASGAAMQGIRKKKVVQLPPRARRFCAFLVGVVFFLSGVLKLMDPVGSGLIVGEYYKFLHLGFLDFSSKFAGTALAFIETMSGVALITGVWRRVTAFIVSCFLAFFTLLTLALLIFNPVMDCGCFGEAIHLTHLQSFLKNVVLCVLTFAAFWPFKSFGRNKRRKYVAFSLVSVAVVALMLYSLLYIPLVDFTEFKPGVRLAASDTHHRQDTDEIYEAVFVYEKGGVQERFTLDALPDSTWTYVSTETVTKARNHDDYTPALSFTDSYGQYQDNLAARGNVLCVTIYQPDRIAPEKWTRLARFAEDAKRVGFRPVVLVSWTPEMMQDLYSGPGMNEDIMLHLYDTIYYADYKAIISLNRSNGGITWFNRGYLVKKWSYNAIPDYQVLEELASGDSTETLLMSDTAGNLTFQGFLLYSFAVMLLL